MTARWSLPGTRTTTTFSTSTRLSTSTWSIVSGSARARRCAGQVQTKPLPTASAASV